MLNLPPLYAITDSRSDLSPSDQVRRLGAAGFPLVQLRGKSLDAGRMWSELKTSLTVAAENGGWPMICVNDRADLALLAAGEGSAPWGLHLGQQDLPPREARRLPGLEALHLGTSTHNLAEWDSVDLCCDHAGIGPFRATQSKGDHEEPIGPEGLRQGCAILRSRGVSPIAIGGLTLADAGPCYEAGAESLAMVGEISRSTKPSELLWQAQALRWAVRAPFQPGQGVALIGGSGCGKSTLARKLARRVGLSALDLDDVIERQAGKPIPRIFAEEGEPAFRLLEARATCEAFGTPQVLALGGGAWESEAIRTAARDAGYAVLWIAENPSLVWNRIGRDPGRPLAQDRAAFMSRWRARTLRWQDAPMVLPLGRSATQLADLLSRCAKP